MVCNLNPITMSNSNSTGRDVKQLVDDQIQEPNNLKILNRYHYMLVLHLKAKDDQRTSIINFFLSATVSYLISLLNVIIGA